jgi:hypothetical protein
MVNAAILVKANLALHIIQALWSVVVMGVVIASMSAKGPASGAIKYMFTMCWFAVPALVYLTQAPRFPRTKMFAHPYWVIGVNTIFSILWFAAFVSVAGYTNGGISDGEGKEKDEKIKKEGGCALFPAGTGEDPKACKMNQAAVGLGVILWFFWLGTTGIAGYAAWYFRQHSVSPFEDLSPAGHDIEETTKDAFSSNDEYAPINRDRDEDDGDSRFSPSHHERSGSVTSYDTGYDAHPGNPVPWGGEGSAYNGIGGHGPVAMGGNRRTPSGLSMPIAPDEDYSYRGATTR